VKDPIAVIEAAYRVESSETDWLEELARVSAATMGSNQGAMAFQFDASSGDWVHITGVAAQGLPPEFVKGLFNFPDLPVEQGMQLIKLYTSITFGSLREAFAPVMPELRELLTHFGIGDMIGINAVDPTGRGCMVGVATSRKAYSNSTRELWKRLAAHLSAGSRLRKTLQALVQEPRDRAAAAEAVLTPDGRVEHAVGDAEPRDAREALRDALVRIDRARSRHESPTTSVELWRGLVSGRWSVVEHFERDGKRYYLAHKNDPELAADRGLTPRERQVFAYAELGQSDKLIAYTLGLSLSTVSTLLSNARRKLGTSLDLIRSSPDSDDGST
jgi:DNA-binding CsgD family transcriptional regulator